MATLIQLRRDTSANWLSNNPILAEGEIGIATDLQQFKIGNSASSWTQLEYVNAIPSQYIALSASAKFDLAGSASAAQNAAQGYADNLISSLVDLAPSTLDTLNELAAALGDDPNFAVSTASAIGERLTISSASATYLSIIDALNTYIPLSSSSSFDPAGSASVAEFNAKDYANSLSINYDLVGSASAAEFNAKAYSDSLATNYDAAGSAASASANSNSYADGAISSHNSDTTSVHGIDDTSLLATKSYVDDAESAAIATASAYSNSLSINYDSIGSASAAELNAKNYADSLAPNYDVAGSASAAQTAAQSYSDSLSINYDAIGSASAAEFNAKAYSDSLAANYDVAGSASAAQTAAQSYADSLAPNYDSAGSASAALNSAKSYTDTEVSNLVNSAPTTLDTLNELAAALGDDPNFAASTASAIGNRLTIANASATYLTINDAAATYIPITSSGSFDVAGSASVAEFNAKSYADSLAVNYDSIGSASAAQVAAQSYADSLAVNYDAVGSASAAEFNANSYTDSVVELYIPISSSAEYLTRSDALNEYLGINNTAVHAVTASSINWTGVIDTPTTLSGYGITDAFPLSSSSNFTPLNILINTQTESSYTLTLSDSGKLIEINSASANTLIIPLNNSAAFPIGTKIDLLQIGLGQTTASADSGVTINSKDGNLKLTGQWSAATLVKRGTDEWTLIGDLSE